MAIEKSDSPSEFVAFELAGWDQNIAGYDRFFGPVSRQTVAPTLDAARVGVGMRVLDVCSGPGMLAAAAAERGAEAVGLDFSSEAVALAQRNVPAATFHQGDAQNLPFPDRSFDAVVCGYGVMHLPEPERAMREMFRVLRPAGHVAVSVWGVPAPDNVLGLIYGAIKAHGDLGVPLPHGPDFFQFSTGDKMRGALAFVGFEDVETRVIDQTWQFATPSEIHETVTEGTVRARALFDAQTEDVKSAIREALENSLDGFRNPDGKFDVPQPALIGSGAKP